MAKKKKIKQLYFQHDAFARDDPKMLQVRIRYGPAGYGVYFMLLEYLSQQPGYMCETNQYDAIGYNLHVPSEMVRSIVEDFGLFTLLENGSLFRSESFSRRMASLDSSAYSRSQAARKAAAARWGTAPTMPEPKNDAEGMRHAYQSDASRMRHASKNDANKIRIEEYIDKSACAHTREEPEGSVSPSVDNEGSYRATLLSEQIFWQQTAMALHLHAEDITMLREQMFPSFVAECTAKDAHHNSIQDYRTHFFNWLRIQIEKQRNGTTTNHHPPNQNGNSTPMPAMGNTADADSQARTAAWQQYAVSRLVQPDSSAEVLPPTFGE